VIKKILLTSDDADSSDVWAYALTHVGFDIAVVTTSEEAISWRQENTSHLILIDENNVDLDGVSLIQTIRPTAVIPILLMTFGESQRALEAYRAGVDECIQKPVLPAILRAKVQAWLRHSAMIPVTLLDNVELGPIRLLPDTQEVITYGRLVSLSNLDFRLLHLLMSHPNVIFSAATLYKRVWGYNDQPDNGTVRTGVYRLRRKLEADPTNPQHILSLSGEGYMFRP
jgi:two-component system, OmpR family, response regulator RpaA